MRIQQVRSHLICIMIVRQLIRTNGTHTLATALLAIPY